MRWWRAVRDDLVKAEAPTRREERRFLIASALIIVSVAQVSDPGSPAHLLVLTPAVVAFVLRGLWPTMAAELFAALVVVPVVLVVGDEGDLEAAFFLVVMVALYTSWHLGSTTRALVVLAVAATSPILVATVLVTESGINWGPWTSASLFMFVLGRLLRRQQALIDQLERAREALARQAVAEERRRIARELHDLAGHTLAAMLLHVTGARHVLRRDADDAERALVDAETVGRASLDQIRATVAALRTHERGTDPALAGSVDLVGLVEEYRRAGLVVEVVSPPTIADLEGPVGVALHRIVREALANVARHAPTNAVDLDIALDAGTVRLRVEDRGRPGVAPDPDAGHFGLVGMRERARALGGDLAAGPTAEGWLVEGRLPLAAAADRPTVAPRSP